MNTRHWIAHFENNRRGRVEPDWSASFTLPERKRTHLARSLAEYQLGDGGGECRLVARDADKFRTSIPGMNRLVDLWFAEEREHSRLLTGAVRRVGGTFVTTTPAMSLFYAVRRALGVEFELLVLLIVEIVSTVYYRSIRKHVGDAPLAAMCRLIIRDEAGHVAFHRERVAAQFPGGVPGGWVLRFHALGFACACFLWLGKNGACLRALGTTRAEFFRQIRAGLLRFEGGIARRLRCCAPAARSVALNEINPVP
ncbi:MAG: ferritin-like domain-containing protein [Chthoniobacteraceae bacterium]